MSTMWKEIAVSALAVGAIVFAANRRAKAKQFIGPKLDSLDFYSTAEQVCSGLDLTGKTYLVTGCTSGIGLETVRVLAKHGAIVLAVGRSAQAVTKAIAGFAGKIVPLGCDLSKPAQILALVKEVGNLPPHALDGIVANAGIMDLPKLELVEGVEAQFFVNHMAHFILITKLLPLLTDTGRVVLVSSAAQFYAPREGIDFTNLDGSKTYDPRQAYGTSKLANMLFAQSLAERFEHTNKLALSLHPGVISTNLSRHTTSLRWLWKKLTLAIVFEPWKTVEQGAATTVFAVAHPQAKLQAKSTHYLHDCREHMVHPAASTQMAEQLWQVSERILRQVEATNK